MIFGPVSSGAVISGNMIANVKAIGNKAGTGIYFDSEGTSNHSVTGNVIKNCEGSAIDNGGSNHDIVISGNVIESVNSIVPGAAVQLTNTLRILISSNNIGASRQGQAIAMLGSSDDWLIVGNHFSGGSSVTLAGAGSVSVDNLGYNPVGNISNPWPLSGTDLTNHVASGQALPQSGTVYTIRHTPKTIVVRGGDVSQIRINFADTGSTAGAFKLGVGETIAITYNTPPPATLVFAE
jgi:putative cofactor-binding repeat protein